MRLLHDPRGHVMVEYAIVLSLLSVGACAAIATAAALLSELFSYQRALITLPFP